MSLSDKVRQYLFYGLTDRGVSEEIADAIDEAAPLSQLGTVHASILSPSHRGSKGGTSEPTPTQIGPALADAYTLNVDQGYQTFKIPSSFVGDLKLHVHWSKSSDANESGKKCRWQVLYKILPGNGADMSTPGLIATIDGTYLDSGTTTRICYRSVDTPLTGGVAGYYLFTQVMAINPNSNPMASEPLLASLDITFTSYLNK